MGYDPGPFSGTTCEPQGRAATSAAAAVFGGDHLGAPYRGTVERFTKTLSGLVDVLAPVEGLEEIGPVG